MGYSPVWKPQQSKAGAAPTAQAEVKLFLETQWTTEDANKMHHIKTGATQNAHDDNQIKYTLERI